jgi:hypothetical protein
VACGACRIKKIKVRSLLTKEKWKRLTDRDSVMAYGQNAPVATNKEFNVNMRSKQEIPAFWR